MIYMAVYTCGCGDEDCWECSSRYLANWHDERLGDDDFIPTGAEDAAGGIVSDADPGL